MTTMFFHVCQHGLRFEAKTLGLKKKISKINFFKGSKNSKYQSQKTVAQNRLWNLQLTSSVLTTNKKLFTVLMFNLSWNYTMFESINMQTHLKALKLLLVVSAYAVLGRSLLIQISITLTVCVEIPAHPMCWHSILPQINLDLSAMHLTCLYSNLVSFPLKQKENENCLRLECVNEETWGTQEKFQTWFFRKHLKG